MNSNGGEQKIRDELMTELWKGGERVTFLNDAWTLNLGHHGVDISSLN